MICDECETVAHCTKHGCVPKHQALDRMAKNARELGLDYETAPAQPAPVQPATRPCRSCDGSGERHTGIAEAPTSICKPCSGTGQIATPPAAQPAPVQEPVAWMYQCTTDNSGPVLLRHRTNWAKSGTGLWIETPLCTASPAAPVPLTDEQIKAVIAKIDPNEHYLPNALRQLARAIEAAHGITKGQQ